MQDHRPPQKEVCRMSDMRVFPDTVLLLLGRPALRLADDKVAKHLNARD